MVASKSCGSDTTPAPTYLPRQFLNVYPANEVEEVVSNRSNQARPLLRTHHRKTFPGPCLTVGENRHVESLPRIPQGRPTDLRRLGVNACENDDK